MQRDPDGCLVSANVHYVVALAVQGEDVNSLRKCGSGMAFDRSIDWVKPLGGILSLIRVRRRKRCELKSK